ncbi:Uncharacterised protein [Moraxella bovis]|uniref:Uncharacterized protein n=1 Tax=Moraxella bovis TaxID=476 RepID=A0A378PZM1_MORBO|nr:Uncharacterised protein [Moraxella bovis]
MTVFIFINIIHAQKEMLYIPWEQVFQARSRYHRHCCYVDIDVFVYADDVHTVTINIRVDSLFPGFSPKSMLHPPMVDIMKHQVKCFKMIG